MNGTLLSADDSEHSETTSVTAQLLSPPPSAPASAAPRSWRILFYVHWFHPLFIGAVTYLLVTMVLMDRYTLATWLPKWHQIPSLFPLPYVISTLLGLCWPRSEPRSKPKQRSFSRLFICVATKGANRDALSRTWSTLKQFQFNFHPSLHMHVVTDEPNYFHDMPCIMVPEQFQTQRAKFKARALEYYRQTMKLTRDDWVLHLDEESVIDAHAIESCIEFIENTTHSFGQGVILYNQYDYWRRPFLTVTDAVRVGDDLGRFHLQYGALHRTVYGAHGSFFLTNGQLENEITWEMTTLCEDVEFAFHAASRGHSCGQISGYLREQSPATIMDLVKQRRRWFWGVIVSKQFFPRLLALQWIGGVVCLVSGILHAIIPALAAVHVPLWLGVCEVATILTFSYLYFLGVFVQDLDRGFRPIKIAFHLAITLVLFPFSQLLEVMAIVYSIACRPAMFEVIKK